MPFCFPSSSRSLTARRFFIAANFSNRKEKGTHRDLDHAQYWSRCRFVLQCDIRQFFPSIDHAILLNMLQRKVADARVLWFCSQILASGGVHPRKVTEEIPLFGFMVFPQRRRVKRRKCIHFQRKLRVLVEGYRAGRLPLCQLTASARGWANRVRYTNSVGLRKVIFRRIFRS